MKETAMNQEKPRVSRQKWQAPQIIEVGGIAEHTTWADGNLRDNQGDANAKWKPFTKTTQVELPPGD